jgi:hypothetical protein
MTDIRPQFTRLLYAAHAASEAVDRFDLHSEQPASVAVWNQLLADEHAASAALVRHIIAHGPALLAQLRQDSAACRVD